MKQSSQWPRPSAASVAGHADGRAEDAAGHGPPRVDIATAGSGIERGAGRIVGEIFEAGAVGVGRSEEAGFSVAGKIGAVLGEPRAAAAFDFGG